MGAGRQLKESVLEITAEAMHGHLRHLGAAHQRGFAAGVDAERQPARSAATFKHQHLVGGDRHQGHKPGSTQPEATFECTWTQLTDFKVVADGREQRFEGSS